MYRNFRAVGWLFILIAYLAVEARAQTNTITYDNTSTIVTGAIGGAGTYGLTHTVTAAEDRALFVCVTSASSDTERVTGVTYDGVAMTKVTGLANPGAANGYTSLWKLAAPHSGSNLVVLTFNAAATFSVGAVSLYNVDQTTPIEASNTASDATGNSPMTVNVTTLTDGAWAIDCGYTSTAASLTVGSGQTSRFTNLTSGLLYTSIGSTEPKATAGSVTMDWSWTGATSGWATIAAAVKPSTFNGVKITDDGTLNSSVGPGFTILGSPPLGGNPKIEARDDYVVFRDDAVTLTNKTLDSPVLTGSLSGGAFKDEDDMASNSATAAPSQQSVKAYVDANRKKWVVFSWGSTTVTSSDQWLALGDANWTTSALSDLTPVGYALSCFRLRVHVTVGCAAGSSWAGTVYVNGAASSASASLGTGTDATWDGTVALSAGDRLSFMGDETGTCASTRFGATLWCEYTP